MMKEQYTEHKKNSWNLTTKSHFRKWVKEAQCHGACLQSQHSDTEAEALL